MKGRTASDSNLQTKSRSANESKRQAVSSEEMLTSEVRATEIKTRIEITRPRDLDNMTQMTNREIRYLR